MNKRRRVLVVALSLTLLSVASFMVFKTKNNSSTEGKDTNNVITDETSDLKASVYAGSYSIEDKTYGTSVMVVEDGGTRIFTTNGLPNHETGTFPNDTNPNTVSEQEGTYKMTANPEKNSKPTTYNVQTAFGIAYNGVLIDRYAAEWYQNDMNSGWQLAGIINDLGFDMNNAHVQPDGTYHYHGAPNGIINSSHETMQLLGFAADGFPVYSAHGYEDPNDSTSEVVDLLPSYQIKSGTRPSGPGGSYDGTYEEDWEYKSGLGDLDECNARAGVTPEFPGGILYYVLTDEYPFVPLCFWGNTDDSFTKTPTGDNQNTPPRNGMPPPSNP